MKLVDLYIKYKQTVDFTVLGLTCFLAATGFGSLGLLAYLNWKVKGDLVYAAIFLVGVVLLIISMIPAYRIHKLRRKFENENLHKNR